MTIGASPEVGHPEPTNVVAGVSPFDAAAGALIDLIAELLAEEYAHLMEAAAALDAPSTEGGTT